MDYVSMGLLQIVCSRSAAGQKRNSGTLSAHMTTQLTILLSIVNCVSLLFLVMCLKSRNTSDKNKHVDLCDLIEIAFPLDVFIPLKMQHYIKGRGVSLNWPNETH